MELGSLPHPETGPIWDEEQLPRASISHGSVFREGSHSTCTPTVVAGGNQLAVSCPKKDGRSATSQISFSPQQAYTSTTLQDGDQGLSPDVKTRGRIDNVDWSTGRISSRPYAFSFVYLRFRVNGMVDQFTSLPFGLASSHESSQSCSILSCNCPPLGHKTIHVYLVYVFCTGWTALFPHNH